MIKLNTIGMLDVAKLNPVLKATKETANYSFITVDDILYLVSNTLTGDDAYREGIVFPKDAYLNGYEVKAWEGQELVIDAKHITGGVDSLAVGTTLVVNDTDGTLKTGSATGVHFVVTDNKARLTEKAVKVKVVVA